MTVLLSELRLSMTLGVGVRKALKKLTGKKRSEKGREESLVKFNTLSEFCNAASTGCDKRSNCQFRARQRVRHTRTAGIVLTGQ